MILAKNIPLHAETFIKRCRAHMMKGHVAPTIDGYRDYLIAVTKRTYPGVLQILRIPDSPNRKTEYCNDVDHVIPRSVWYTLMFGLPAPKGNGQFSFNVLPNLVWRDPGWNRKEDHLLIEVTRKEAKSIQLSSPEGLEWRYRRMEMFLRTKHDEGLSVPVELMDHRDFDNRMSDEGWPE